MITFTSCKDYQVIHRETNDCDAVALCERLEQERNDGYAVVAWSEGKYYADAEGYHEDRNENRVYEAQYAHACGYVD